VPEREAVVGAKACYGRGTHSQKRRSGSKGLGGKAKAKGAGGGPSRPIGEGRRSRRRERKGCEKKAALYSEVGESEH